MIPILMLVLRFETSVLVLDLVHTKKCQCPTIFAIRAIAKTEICCLALNFKHINMARKKSRVTKGYIAVMTVRDKDVLCARA